MTEGIDRLRGAGADAVQRGHEAASRGALAVHSGVETVREQAAEVRGQAAAAIARVKPRLRGVIHEYAFFAAIALGGVLVASAHGGRQVAATVVYALGICGLFGVSALYHRVTWRPGARTWMRRLDHSMIFVFIAASFTPFAILVCHGTLATAVLCVVWVGAAAGVVLSLLWIGAPRWVSVLVYAALGLVGVVLAPELWNALGVAPVLLIVLGGALYAAGAVVYAAGRPDPAPSVFGYHEIFHSLVTGAAATHYAVIIFFVLPFAG